MTWLAPLHLCPAPAPRQTFKRLDQLRHIQRPLRRPMYGPYAALLRDVLWADPTDSDAMAGTSRREVFCVKAAARRHRAISRYAVAAYNACQGSMQMLCAALRFASMAPTWSRPFFTKTVRFCAAPKGSSPSPTMLSSTGLF